jgi:hypothetical protein
MISQMIVVGGALFVVYDNQLYRINEQGDAKRVELPLPAMNAYDGH